MFLIFSYKYKKFRNNAHLSRLFDTLPYTEIYDDPGKSKTSYQIPSQTSNFINARRYTKSALPIENKSNQSTS